jgi:hypothetical protein
MESRWAVTGKAGLLTLGIFFLRFEATELLTTSTRLFKTDWRDIFMLWNCSFCWHPIQFTTDVNIMSTIRSDRLLPDFPWSGCKVISDFIVVILSLSVIAMIHAGSLGSHDTQKHRQTILADALLPLD